MIATWIGSLALRAYPRETRSERGEEMLGTLLDAHEDSQRAFVRGCASLLRIGWGERARVSAEVGPARMVADGLCQAAVLFAVWGICRQVRFIVDLPGGYSETWQLVSIGLLGIVVIARALGRERIGGICGLVVAVHGLAQPGSFSGSYGVPHDAFLVQWVLLLGCFAVMALMPRRVKPSPRAVIWLIAAVALILAEPFLISLAFLIAVPLIGIIELPVNPRLAVASAAFWAEQAVTSRLAQTNIGLITIPILLFAVALAVTQQRLALRQQR
jgi:hypothetical protein